MDAEGVFWQLNMFVTAGPLVELWDHKRSEPINSFSWGADSATSVRFNPVRCPPPPTVSDLYSSIGVGTPLFLCLFNWFLL